MRRDNKTVPGAFKASDRLDPDDLTQAWRVDYWVDKASAAIPADWSESVGGVQRWLRSTTLRIRRAYEEPFGDEHYANHVRLLESATRAEHAARLRRTSAALNAVIESGALIFDPPEAEWNDEDDPNDAFRERFHAQLTRFETLQQARDIITAQLYVMSSGRSAQRPFHNLNIYSALFVGVTRLQVLQITGSNKGLVASILEAAWADAGLPEPKPVQSGNESLREWITNYLKRHTLWL